MLGSLTDADDAVQDAWLRLSRAGADEVENLGAWLTTVVARVCLNMLRSRNTRREREVFDLLVTGRTNAEIARVLVIAETTAKTHVNHALRATGYTPSYSPTRISW
jgi:DNA-directed RNA polymerase specialized sigma24 family protein